MKCRSGEFPNWYHTRPEDGPIEEGRNMSPLLHILSNKEVCCVCDCLPAFHLDLLFIHNGDEPSENSTENLFVRYESASFNSVT